MSCRLCHGQMTEKTITVELRVNGKLLIVEGEPAKGCDTCGEKVFTPAVTKKLQNLAKQRKKTAPNSTSSCVHLGKRRGLKSMQRLQRSRIVFVKIRRTSRLRGRILYRVHSC